MGILASLANFALGGLVGAVAGAAAAALLTPYSGDELKQKIRDRIEAGRRARIEAETATTIALRQRFREKVNDPTALSDLTAPPSQS